MNREGVGATKSKLDLNPPFASAVSLVWICDVAGRKGWGTHSVVRAHTFCTAWTRFVRLLLASP
jgi:hypothetical protein